MQKVILTRIPEDKSIWVLPLVAVEWNKKPFTLWLGWIRWGVMFEFGKAVGAYGK